MQLELNFAQIVWYHPTLGTIIHFFRSRHQQRILAFKSLVSLQRLLFAVCCIRQLQQMSQAV